MPILANAGTFAPENIIQLGTPVVLVQNLITDYPLVFNVPKNEVWQVLYIGMRVELNPFASVTINGAHGLVGIPGFQSARAEASVVQIQGPAAPSGTFAITPGTPYGDVGPGRQFGLILTVTSTVIGADVVSADLVAEIRRFRLVTDHSVVQIPADRALMEGLNMNLLNRR